MNARYRSTRATLRLVAGCLLAATVAGALTPSHAQWAAQGGGADVEEGRAVAIDAAGNAYATGYFRGQAVFGPFTLTSEGGTDVYVAKYAPSGDLLWVRSAGGGTGWDDEEVGFGVAADADGNAYVTGYFTRGAAFGPFTFTGDGGFLAKYSPEGDVLWVERFGTNDATEGADVAVDAAGNAHVTGQFAGTVAFGSYVLTASSLDVFVVKYDPTGAVLWARSAGAGDLDQGKSISVDAAGNAFVTGGFWDTAVFGPYVLTSAGRSDVFVAKYGPDGAVLWAVRAGGPYNGTLSSGDAGLGVAADADGNAYVSGFFWDTADFGPFTLTSAGDRLEVFVAKYTTSGDVLWAKSAAWAPMGRDVAVDPDGNAYVVGYFSGTVYFGPYTLVSAGSADVYLARYTPDGTVLGAWGAGGASTNPAYGDQGFGVAVDAAGAPHITGFFRDTATFGPSTLTSAGEIDVFVAKFEPDPAVIVAAVPENPPVVVPPGGGAFQFAVTLTNATDELQTFLAWSSAEGPASREPVLGPVTVTLPPGGAVTRTLTQRVPGNAPAGMYTYRVDLGAFPEPVGATSTFTFTKAASAGRGADVIASDGWAVDGWDEAAAARGVAELSEGFALSEVYPNPFGDRATLRFALPEGGGVRLTVYDALGRAVAVLVDGHVEAGWHEAVLDGRGLPAGVYLVRMTAGSAVQTQRVTLVR